MKLFNDDCLNILKALDADSIDAIVTDPPYALTQDKNSKVGIMDKHWDARLPSIEIWQECLRVVKPGAHLLSFGSPRTHHRLMTSIEDAGWQIRDVVMWVYGSGWPKGLNISKAIDGLQLYGGSNTKQLKQVNESRPGEGRTRKSTRNHGVMGEARGEKVTNDTPVTDEAKQWQGWNTALKPAWEPIVVARKPFEGSVAENVLKYGTGGLNIDECRVATTDNLNGGAYAQQGSVRHDGTENWRYKREGDAGEFKQPVGRYAANLVHDGSEQVLNSFPTTTSGKQGAKGHCRNSDKHQNIYAPFVGQRCEGDVLYGDSGSAARFFKSCPPDVEESRLFYAAKASKSERGEGNNHVSVKPLSLMKYLITLVAPKGAIILDPFAGSFTTGVACQETGHDFIGIEIDEGYFKIGKKRLNMV